MRPCPFRPGQPAPGWLCVHRRKRLEFIALLASERTYWRAYPPESYTSRVRQGNDMGSCLAYLTAGFHSLLSLSSGLHPSNQSLGKQPQKTRIRIPKSFQSAASLLQKACSKSGAACLGRCVKKGRHCFGQPCPHKHLADVWLHLSPKGLQGHLSKPQELQVAAAHDIRRPEQGLQMPLALWPRGVVGHEVIPRDLQ